MKLFLLFIFAASASATWLPDECDVIARTEAGMVCGKKLNASNGDLYASFKGMRYARAPRRELRFADPQPPRPHSDIFKAIEHGPVCPQVDVSFGPLLQPKSMDEDCLRINVYTPLDSLPDPDADSCDEDEEKPLLPVLFWINGGSFSYGSGDSDIHGPEYLMSGKGIIMVTINYRMNVFGFLSLRSKEIPGNAGLRDILFALKWVQNNIEAFGGDPAQVTLAGQSAGAVLTSLISVSPATQGRKYFNRIMCFSGVAITGFYTYYPTYTKFITPLYLTAAGINVLQSPEDIYKDLINAPVERLLKANKILLDFTGLLTLGPVIENIPQPGFETIIPEDPEILLNEGSGKEFGTWLQFTNDEFAVSEQRMEEVHVVKSFRLVPSLTLPLNIVYYPKNLSVPWLTRMQMREYFNDTLITLDKYVPVATDQFFKYPALRLLEKRLETCAEPTYLSQFAFYDKHNPFKIIQQRDWPGAAHAEDITYFFRVNSIMGPLETDELAEDNEVSRMKLWMTDLVARYVKTGSPVEESESTQWPPSDDSFSFQNISVPFEFQFRPLTAYLHEKKTYFDKLYAISRGH